MTPEAQAVVRRIAGEQLHNAAEVADAFIEGRCLPPLRLQCGFTVFHAPQDPAAVLLSEIFDRQIYTSGDFYTPVAGDVIVDGGANIGMFALYLLSRCRGLRIYCFEPAAATRNRLLHNLEANGLREATVFPYALWSECTTMRVAAAASSGDTSLFERATTLADAPAEKVETVTLARALALAGDGPVALLKLDVEGAEAEILQAADDVDWSRIARVAVEYHDFVRAGSRARVLERLRGAGFDQIESDTDPNLGIIRAYRA